MFSCRQLKRRSTGSQSEHGGLVRLSLTAALCGILLSATVLAEGDFAVVPWGEPVSFGQPPGEWAEPHTMPYETPNSLNWMPDEARIRWLADAEVVFLKPRFEDGAEEDSQTNLFDFKLTSSPRVSLAMSSPTGLALRSRYWQYGALSTVAAGNHSLLAGTRHRMFVEAYTIELDVAQQLDFGPLKMELALGARNAWFEQGVEATDAASSAFKTFHAAGPVLSLDTLRPLDWMGLELIGNIRGSILVGTSDWVSPTHDQSTDDTGATFDARLGMQWRRDCGLLGELFVRAVWEQQMWFGAGSFFNSTASPAAAAFNVRSDDHDVAFMGFAFALGLER